MDVKNILYRGRVLFLVAFFFSQPAYTQEKIPYLPATINRQGILEAVYSDDGKVLAFVKDTPQSKVLAGMGELPATEIWTAQADGSEMRRLVVGRSVDQMEATLAQMHSLAFSEDGLDLYFLSAAWCTSDALHSVDLKMGREKFICGANWFELIKKGRYKNHFLVSKHKYFLGGGSYDWIWLLAPEGTEVGPVSDGFVKGQIECFYTGVNSSNERMEQECYDR